MMSALEPPPALIKVPFRKGGHRRPSLRLTEFATAQLHNPLRAVIHTELSAFDNSDKENL